MALVRGGADVGGLSVKNLQAILVARCFKPKGKKADLVGEGYLEWVACLADCRA